MSLLHLSKAVFETARISVPTVFEGLTGTLTSEACDRRLESWSERLLTQARITVDVKGAETIPKDEAFVVMSNHQSLYDIPVILWSLKRTVRMVAKSELFKIPLWSTAMRRAGMIEVDRKDRARAISHLMAAKSALEHGTDIWIAPEGTRSKTGLLGPFKLGGFHLALTAGARILPVSIDGTRHALVAKGGSVREGAHVRVTISPPIDPKTFPNGVKGRKQLAAAVRNAIAAHLSEEQMAAQNVSASDVPVARAAGM